MLCAPVFIFTSGSSALLGRPRCGLLTCQSLLAIFNTLFWVYADFFTKIWTKHENSRSPPFSYHTKMAADVNTGAQSINTENWNRQTGPITDPSMHLWRPTRLGWNDMNRSFGEWTVSGWSQPPHFFVSSNRSSRKAWQRCSRRW